MLTFGCTALFITAFSILSLESKINLNFAQVLIRQVVEAMKGKTSKLTGEPIMVCAAGGIADGAGLAASLALGAQAAWVGTRFLCSTESRATQRHQVSRIICR